MQLISLHNTMRERCLAAGITEQHYTNLLRDIDTMSLETLEALFDWLMDLFEGPYQNMYAIWRLKPADWWYNMEVLYRQRKTREQQLLRKEYKKLRKAWYNRNGNAEEGQESVEDTSGSPAEGE